MSQNDFDDREEWAAIERSFYRSRQNPAARRAARIAGLALALAASIGGWWGFYQLVRAALRAVFG